MTVNTKDMAGVSVITQSGDTLGKVASFDLDQATGHLVSLLVKPGSLMRGLISSDLRISWEAIIELGPQRVVVADGAARTASSDEGALIRPVIESSSAMTRQQQL